MEWAQFVLQIVKKLQNYRFKKGKERTNSVGGLYIKKTNKQTKQNSHTGIVPSSSDLMYKKYIQKAGLQATRFVAKIYL